MSDQAQSQTDDPYLMEIEQALAKAIPTKICAPANRKPLAESFLETLGRLVEFAEQFKPMNHGQMAAFMFFVENMNLRRLGADDGCVVLAIVEGAKRAARKARRTTVS